MCLAKGHNTVFNRSGIPKKSDNKRIYKTQDDKTNNIESAPGKYMLSNAFHPIHFQPIISIVHGAGHVTFVIHYTIVSNIIVLSSRWCSVVYR